MILVIEIPVNSSLQQHKLFLVLEPFSIEDVLISQIHPHNPVIVSLQHKTVLLLTSLVINTPNIVLRISVFICCFLATLITKSSVVGVVKVDGLDWPVHADPTIHHRPSI